nr:cytochrome b6-f complex subunit PetP [Lophurella pseudocorticata]
MVTKKSQNIILYLLYNFQIKKEYGYLRKKFYKQSQFLLTK